MKTKIRIQTTHSNAFGVNYNHMTIDVLTERHKGSRYLEPIGQITFQSNRDKPNDWYAINFVTNTSKPDYILQMGKLAKHIMSNRSGYDAQPAEIISLIGGEEYVFFDGEYIAKKDNGKHIYNVVKPNSLIERIVAANEKEGEKLLAKMKITGATLKFNKTINI